VAEEIHLRVKSRGRVSYFTLLVITGGKDTAFDDGGMAGGIFLWAESLVRLWWLLP